jgi:CheY-like chemotaxis protein
MNGIEFRRQQLADAALREIPVILYSASHALARVGREMGLAGENVTQKPLNFDTLGDRLRQYCTA